MKILVTGAAGFIGFHLCRKLIKHEYDVLGLDNLNPYYDVSLKHDRLKQLGIDIKSIGKSVGKAIDSKKKTNFSFIKADISDRTLIPEICTTFSPDIIINLAAQAGVRYSIENPNTYIDSNILGFHNILEAARSINVPHLIFASSSSVYGNNNEVPFSTKDRVDEPVSLYAATKKSNEILAYSYSHLYNLPVTGLRFFTVYGPWGRPDMAYYKFTKAICNGTPIEVYNQGKLARDFTYIDDVVNGITTIVKKGFFGKENQTAPYNIYNIGRGRPEKLMDFIDIIEKKLNRKAFKEFLPMQQGDVFETWANVDALIKDYNYTPTISLDEGIANFVDWYNSYTTDFKSGC